ncbi:MAG: hypothetical protein ABR595_04485 [Psychroflexus sp.]
MKNNKKVGFIFLDGMHHIYHFITIAVELSKKAQVSILTYPAKHDFLKKELHRLGGDQVKIEIRKTDFFTGIIEFFSQKKIPRASIWIKKNRQYFIDNFDAIIFNDFIHHKLTNYEKKKNLPLVIKLDHGIPGRKFAFKKDLKDFDYQLVLGHFDKKQFAKKGLLAKHHKMIGYQKIDAVQFDKKKSFFDNDKITVIYTPHFEKNLSSWYNSGKQILEYFYSQNQYNLIFAPHIQLFKKRKGVSRSEVEKKFHDCPHIHIDFGSQNSVDMSYTKSADIYLGDISSQVYEFIIKPRPCIFFNSHQIEWQNDVNFRFWKCGDVVSSVSELDLALKTCDQKFDNHFKEIQKQINDENFYTEPNSSASELASKAILEFMK